jgi:choline dehydrogenase-like flavoprotein
MNYQRGSKADYDNWNSLGTPNWGWSDLLPYLRKSTTFFPPSTQTVSNSNVTWDPSVYDHGPLSVSIDDFQYPDTTTWWSAWRARTDIPIPKDYNTGAGPGIYWMESTIDPRDGTRASARKEYYDPICGKRKNLAILTGHTATEILFRRLRATGVSIVSRVDGSVSQVFAKKEGIHPNPHIYSRC